MLRFILTVILLYIFAGLCSWRKEESGYSDSDSIQKVKNIDTVIGVGGMLFLAFEIWLWS